MKIFNKVKPLILAGAIGCHYAAQAAVKDVKAPLNKLEMTLDAETLAVMDYDKNYVIASTKEGTYERFERKGYDGTTYCMQIFHLPDLTEWVDGLDGVCDDKIEAFNWYYEGEKGVYFCDEYGILPYNPCDKINQDITPFKADNRIDLINEVWNNNRESCNESMCSIVLKEKPDTMSKKNVK